MNLLYNKGVKKLREWREDKVKFVKECIGATPTMQQEQLLTTYDVARRTTIRSGHGTGKDACTAWCILHFLITRPYPRIACTAPTGRQLGDILWSELSKWLRMSSVASEFVIQSDKIFLKGAPKEWWCRAITASIRASKDEQAETLAGLHNDHLLIVVDEASGVPDPVYIPLEGTLTQEDNHVILIGNMTKSSGYFYDSHFKASIARLWNKFHWNSEKSENVSEEFVNYMAEKYGEDSNVYAVRVKGDPPSEGDDTLIPISWSNDCIYNTFEGLPDDPRMLGVDVARFGSDESVVLPRKMNKIYPWKSFQGVDTATLGDLVIQKHSDFSSDFIGIDGIGLGAGTIDFINSKYGNPRFLYEVNVSQRSSNPERFAALRDELWWEVREKCRKKMYDFPDITVKLGKTDIHLGEELCNELARPKYEFLNESKIKVESKKAMRLRGEKSPNIADALCITEYFSGVMQRMQVNQTRGKTQKQMSLFSEENEYSWMVL